MKKFRDWQQKRAMWIRVLEESTSEDLDTWNRRIKCEGFHEEQILRAWLAQQGVTGYAKSPLSANKKFVCPDMISARLTSRKMTVDWYMCSMPC